jgi:tetratricopeptide (TPR) repeat protein
MKKIGYSLIVLFVFLSHVLGQSKSLQKADKYYEKYSFDKAIKRYTDVPNLEADEMRKLALSYKNRNEYAESAVVYSKLVETPSATKEDFFNYELILKAIGKYEEAALAMQKMQAKDSSDLRVKSFVETQSKFQSLQQENKDFIVKNLKINSEYDDFGTCYFKKQIMYSSNAIGFPFVRRMYNWTQTPFLDLVVADLDSAELVKPMLFNKKINNKWHEGPASFNKAGTYMAFTRNNYNAKSTDDVVKLSIYFSQVEKGDWSEPVPFNLNSSEYSVGHPCLAAHGTIMFFASDMPGGFGGTDLYYVKKEGKDKWSEPINLGAKINTEGNEMFPFYEEKNEFLFFSSNGRAGLGGLDVFVAFKTPRGFEDVQNLGAPINTNRDDFAFIIEPKLKSGYFSSNREGGKGGDDIYHFSFAGTFKRPEQQDTVKKCVYKLMVLNTETGKPLSGVSVKLNTLETKSNELGLAIQEFNKGGVFVDSISAIGYVPTTKLINICQFSSKEILNDTVSLVVQKDKAIELKNIYYDFDKSDILPESAAELDKVVDFMQQNPSLNIELS